MQELTKSIYEIIIAEANAINNKVKGLNFLELLKINLAEKLLPLISEQKFPLNDIIEFKKGNEEDFRSIKISINYYTNPLSISKKNIYYDSLFISFNEASNFDIFKDTKKFTSILLYKNTAMSLPKDTLINLKINKNVLFLEINNINIEEILKK